MKLLSPSAFLRHISNLNLRLMAGVPPFVLPCLAGLLAAAECTLGTSLLVRIFPDQVFPVGIGTLVLFAAITTWGATTRRLEDCGCYGNMFAVTPLQSVLLTLFYAALIAAAWYLPVGFALSPAAQTVVLVGSGAFFGGVTVASVWSRLKFGEDLLDTSPIKLRRHWNPSWLDGFSSCANRPSQLVVLMSAACPVCEAWVKPLNKISHRAGMPQVIAGMAAPGDKINNFLAEYGVEFPVLPVKAGTMARLAAAFPTLVTVEDGLITSVNVAQLPPVLLNQLGPRVPGGMESPSAAALTEPDQPRQPTDKAEAAPML